LVRRAACGGPNILNFCAYGFSKVGFKLELATQRLADLIGNPGCIRQQTITADAARVLSGDGIITSAIRASCSLIKGAIVLLVSRNQIPKTTASDVRDDFERRITRCTSILAESADGVFGNKRKGVITTALGDSEIPHEEAGVIRVGESQKRFELTTRGYLVIFLRDDGIWIGRICSVGAKRRALIRVCKIVTRTKSWNAAATTEGTQVSEIITGSVGRNDSREVVEIVAGYAIALWNLEIGVKGLAAIGAEGARGFCPRAFAPSSMLTGKGALSFIACERNGELHLKTRGIKFWHELVRVE
jgi:hypothetical protein